MEGTLKWISLFTPLMASIMQLILAGCFILVALQFSLWRKHIRFHTSYLVQARAADFNMLLHLLALERERLDESDPQIHRIDRQMDILADAKAEHYERNIDGNGHAKRP